jgi:hypothetical protein
LKPSTVEEALPSFVMVPLKVTDDVPMLVEEATDMVGGLVMAGQEDVVNTTSEEVPVPKELVA